jgi:hypothetical protein
MATDDLDAAAKAFSDALTQQLKERGLALMPRLLMGKLILAVQDGENMRDAQRRYFRTRAREDLIASKEAEKAFDRAIAALDGEHRPPMPDPTPADRALCCGPTCKRGTDATGPCVADTYGAGILQRAEAAGYLVISAAEYVAAQAEASDANELLGAALLRIADLRARAEGMSARNGWVSKLPDPCKHCPGKMNTICIGTGQASFIRCDACKQEGPHVAFLDDEAAIRGWDNQQRATA